MPSRLGCYPRVALAGFRRYSTYRQATAAGLTTNVVFGLMRVAVLFAALDAAPNHATISGLARASTATYVWLGQGMIAFVLLWGGNELAERIRSGDVVVDLYRPWDLQAAQLAADLGRAGHAALTRLLPPLVFGALFFPFRWPERATTWPLFAVAAVLALLVSFAIRFLLSILTFWLLDNRGVLSMYGVTSALLSGLTLPLAFFPDWASTALSYTPFPALMQSPIDVFLERGDVANLVARQAFWVVLLIVAGRVVLRRAARRVVVQGG
ncbi:ABC transporter permease [Solihabitans fulvus]|uniref:ABC transporter permease n=1 Tax=Solihabitans fulvus TaxID=1892852 RepID=A0A5B2XMI3_9PSEU|nr:ABC-2 family transporter protein [Solihabitans fulvus]KAA2264603.1 ABC transporter permease [Solihabitans fulvus]